MARTTLLLLILFCAVQRFAPSASAADTQTVLRSCACRHCQNADCSTRGDWHVVETTNFSVWSRSTKHQAVETAEMCEQLRSRLQTDWKLARERPWQPKCAIVVHAGIDEYRRELGSLNRSVGCTTITCDDGRVVFRRIDLRADAGDWQSNALPHELTHVVLADRFAGCALPHWLNEGLAMLAENDELRHRRETVLASAYRRGDLPSLQSVLASDDRFPHHDTDVGYAVSASLVRRLEQHLGRDSLLDFAERLSTGRREASSADALAQVGDLEEWERRWHDSIGRIEPAPLIDP